MREYRVRRVLGVPDKRISIQRPLPVARLLEFVSFVYAHTRFSAGYDW